MLDLVQVVQLALATLMALEGFPALLAVVMTTLEYFKLLDVDKADVFSFWANAVAFGGLFVAVLFDKLPWIAELDLSLGGLAKLLVQLLIILGIPIGLAKTKKAYGSLRSHSFLGLM